MTTILSTVAKTLLFFSNAYYERVTKQRRNKMETKLICLHVSDKVKVCVSLVPLHLDIVHEIGHGGVRQASDPWIEF